MGLLSMVAARLIGGGAAAATATGAPTGQIVAVDTSAIVTHAAEVAKVNKLSNLRFIRGSFVKKEVDLPDEFKATKFDVILCEWPSAFVTNDTALLKELLYCREHLLKPDGVICPNQASLHVGGVSDYAYRHDTMAYWDNVYGFKMSAMKELVAKEPTAGSLGPDLVATNTTVLKTVKIADVKSADDFTFEGDFTVTANAKATLHFLTFFVDATFLHPVEPGANFVLPFAPGASNPWTEVSAQLPEPLPLNIGDAVKGHVKVSPRGDVTDLTIDVEVKNALIEHKSRSQHHFQY